MTTELPTLSLPDAQAQKLVEIFGSAAGYKKWLKQSIRVQVVKARRASAVNLSDEDAAVEFPDLLPDPEPEPEPEPEV